MAARWVAALSHSAAFDHVYVCVEEWVAVAAYPNGCTSLRIPQPMAPKRKLEPVDRDDSSVSSSSDSPPPLYLHPAVASHAALFADLPSDVTLTQIVGVATCLSARIAALQHSTASGNTRVYRDCIRVIRNALSVVSPAIMDLAGLQLVLQHTLEQLTTGLDQVITPSRRSRRR